MTSFFNKEGVDTGWFLYDYWILLTKKGLLIWATLVGDFCFVLQVAHGTWRTDTNRDGYIPVT